MARDAVAAQAEIAKLKFQLARYRRAEFGRSSEKLAREIEQLELAIETLGERPGRAAGRRLADAWPRRSRQRSRTQKPARRPLPDHLPREEVRPPGRLRLPALRRRLAPDRRGRDRDPRLRARPLQGDPARSREAVLPRLRHGGRGAGARSRDRPRPRRGRAARAHRRLEVRRPPAALSPGRDLRPRGRRAWRPRPCPAGSGRRRRRCSRWSTRSPPR